VKEPTHKLPASSEKISSHVSSKARQRGKVTGGSVQKAKMEQMPNKRVTTAKKKGEKRRMTHARLSPVQFQTTAFQILTAKIGSRGECAE